MNSAKRTDLLSHNIYKSYILVVLISIVVSAIRCAQIEAPPGGPEDKKPPQILAVSPAEGAVNIPNTSAINIIFSKPMNHELTERAIFISPLTFEYPSFKWSGKRLEIIMPETLRQNTTYVVTIGASAKDLRGNSLGKSISFPFSTGPEISNGVISGQVIGGAGDVIDIWAYAVDDDKEKFFRRLPDYITQSDSLGEFRFDYISPGEYLVVAVNDKNKNQFWTPPSEKLALPAEISFIKEDSAVSPRIWLTLAERDTLPPQLSKINSPDSTKIELEFSCRLDEKSALDTTNFRIMPADNPSDSVKPAYSLFVDDSHKIIQLGGLSLIPKRHYRIDCLNLISFSNTKAESLSQRFAAGSADTIRPKLSHGKPPESAKAIASNTEFELLFSEAIDTAVATTAVNFVDSAGSTLAPNCLWSGLNRAVLRPSLPPGETYSLTIDQSRIIDMAGNAMGDSLLAFKYAVAPGDTFGELSGRIIGQNQSRRYIVQLTDKVHDTIFVSCAPDGRFTLGQLFPGTYWMLILADIDGDSRFNPGRHDPFQFAEPLFQYPDSVIIRSRWETDLGDIFFGGR